MSNRIVNMADGPDNPSPGLKVSWANHHLSVLNSELQQFLDRKPYTISTEDDLERGEHIFRIDTGAFPVTLGLIVGDFACCLRGSLDHLAYALTLGAGGTPNDRASFPVLESMNAERRRQFDKAVVGIPAEAVALIDSLQPYRYGDAFKSSKLWRLHRLWNIDKHRRVPFHATVAKTNIRCPADMMPITSRTKYGTETRFTLSAKGKVNLEPPVDVRIEFGDKSEGIIIPSSELIEIYEFVRNSETTCSQCLSASSKRE